MVSWKVCVVASVIITNMIIVVVVLNISIAVPSSQYSFSHIALWQTHTLRLKQQTSYSKTTYNTGLECTGFPGHCISGHCSQSKHYLYRITWHTHRWLQNASKRHFCNCSPGIFADGCKLRQNPTSAIVHLAYLLVAANYIKTPLLQLFTWHIR